MQQAYLWGYQWVVHKTVEGLSFLHKFLNNSLQASFEENLKLILGLFDQIIKVDFQICFKIISRTHKYVNLKCMFR